MELFNEGSTHIRTSPACHCNEPRTGIEKADAHAKHPWYSPGQGAGSGCAQMARVDLALLKFVDTPTPWDPHPSRPDYQSAPWMSHGLPYTGATDRFDGQGRYYSSEAVPAEVLHQAPEQMQFCLNMSDWELEFEPNGRRSIGMLQGR